MSNPFSTTELLYPLTKGLVRHTPAGQKVALMAGEAHAILGKHDMVARQDAHKRLAEEHRAIASHFKGMGMSGLAILHNQASVAHEQASEDNSDGDSLNARSSSQQAIDATQTAVDATTSAGSAGADDSASA